MSNHDHRPGGFSLLEVMIATAILATSTILLLSLFSTGERHAKKAETRVLGQMLCQSKLDELLADPALIRSVVEEPLAGYDNWTYSVDWTATGIDGLVSLRVSVSEVREQDWLKDTRAAADRQAFGLVRWTRYEPHSGLVSDDRSYSLLSSGPP